MSLKCHDESRGLVARMRLGSASLWMLCCLSTAALAAAPAKPGAEVGPALSDRIVAVVNDAPITWFELLQRTAAVARENRVTESPALRKQVLEQLIDQRAQVQAARQEGIVVSEEEIDNAERVVAGNNKMSVASLRAAVAKDGLSVLSFRQQLSDQLAVQRMRERFVSADSRSSQADIDAFLEAQAAPDGAVPPPQLQLAQIFFPIREDATAAEKDGVMASVDRVREALNKGESFAALAVTYSKAPEGVNGGDMGVRNVADYPALFADATAALAVGAVSAPVTSGAGVHLLKVLGRPLAKAQMTASQTRARHILLQTGPQLSEQQAVETLRDVRAELLAGKRDFAALAKAYSQDGSAAGGGDLGWVDAGAFVPEFEGPMNRLAVSEVSEPVVSRFGVHLIEVLDRRRVPLSEEAQNEAVSNLLRQKAADEAFAKWTAEARARAYVDIREWRE